MPLPISLNLFPVVFVIVRKRFLEKAIFGKSTGKVESMDRKKYNSGVSCPVKKKLTNNASLH